MNMYVEQLGVIKKGELKFNDLTLLCGANNTGKTYVMYSWYGLLNKDFEVYFDFVQEIVEQLVAKNVYQVDLHELITQYFDDMIRGIEESFFRRLPKLFSVEDAEFANTQIKLKFEQDTVLQNAIKNEWKTQLSLGKDNNWFLDLEKAADQVMLTLTLRLAANIPTRILITMISSHLIELIFPNISHSCFLLPAERSGLNLFFKELSSIRNQLLHHAQKDHLDPMAILRDTIKSRYAEPIADYLEFLNNLEALKKQQSEFAVNAQEIQQKILQGEYQIEHEGGIYFLPNHGKKKLPLHFASSVAKTFFGLVFYLNHLAQKGDCLMIDEPELNLHLANQRIIAKILVRLMNAGLKVVISTHSIHLVRELNNLIMLNQSFSEAESLRQRYGYLETDSLDSNRVFAYSFDDEAISLMEIDPNEGIIAETFDKSLENLNRSSDDIYYAIQDE